MEIQQILSRCDHTQLSQCATLEDIKALIDDAKKYHTASVCIPPCYVKQAVEYAKFQVPICTVIGFPNGYNATAVKEYETALALNDGADEIDMVINIGQLKAGNYSYVENEIRTLKRLCGSKVLKVIIETCLLTDEEKQKMCEIISNAGADFIKTSTGFSSAGAKLEDIILFGKFIKPEVKIKAAGGIRSIEDAEKFIEAGASRLGTSAIVKIVKSEE